MRQGVFRAGQLWRQFTDVRRFDEATRAAKEAQEAKLREILDANKDTVYGKKHGFDKIHSVDEYRSRVPVNEYGDLEPFIERVTRGESNVLTREDPMMFALTSGTTGSAKFIPVTPSYLAEYNHAVQVHLWRMLEDYPDVGQGTFLVPSSCDVEGHTESGKPYGAISGFLTKNQPDVVRKFFALPYEMAIVKDVESKYYLTLLLAIQADIRFIASVNPSSLLLLAEKLQQHAEGLVRAVREGKPDRELVLPDATRSMLRERLRPNPQRARELERLASEHGTLLPRHVWPNLRIISCWKGGTMPLYLQRLPRLWGEAAVRDLGYMASEGRGSVPLVNAGAAGAVALTSHFFEFIPVEQIDDPYPACFTADELVPDREYYVLFTTSSGLYRYHINDIIRVVDYHRTVPLIQFVRKGQGISSITGEKLTESQMTGALMEAVEASGLHPAHFSSAPRFGEPPYYELMVELEEPQEMERKRRFVELLDASLAAGNVEYQAKRESQRLGPPVLHVLAPGSFTRYRQERVSQGAPEAQVKIPHLSPKFEWGKQFEVDEEVRLA